MNPSLSGAALTAEVKAARPLRVLLVEDSEADALLIRRALERGGFAARCLRVDTRETMEKALRSGTWDLVLADHSMPRFSAPEALDLVKAAELDVPFIIVSGFIEEETAISAMEAGAHDYVMKDQLARLLPAVERELREAESRRLRRESEQQLQRAREDLEVRVAQRTAALSEANAKLQKVIEERRRLENELLEIAENERRRIGLDLHDDLGQKLTGASLMIMGLEQRLRHSDHPAREDAARIRELVDEIIRHTHNLAHQHASLDADGDDLRNILKDLAASVHKMFDLPCVFAARGSVPPLPADTTLQFYKIAQEAVSNAIKHGKATQVSITLSMNGEELIMTVRNDGIPFAPSEARNRMGLRIMNYRANTVGALLEIKPETEGTLVTCALRLGRLDPADARAEKSQTERGRGEDVAANQAGRATPGHR